MASTTELARLAAAVNLLRPDWPTASVQGYLVNTHADKPYADLAVALVACAVADDTETPKRVELPGPWWKAARVASGRSDGTQPPRHGDPTCETHPWEYAISCRACAADAKAGDA
ncbi:MAG: hypothetical protein ACRDP6_47315 [Actinoallomurus sp.]